jgi:hypothetical protein
MDFSSVVRTLPLVAPDELIPWLLKHDLIPRSPEMDMQIEEYWQYLSSKGFPGTSDKPGSGCIPLWLWGDDCKYNKEGAKIVVVALGAVLQNSASAKDTVFPLFSFQVDTRLKKKCVAMIQLAAPKSSPSVHPRSKAWGLRRWRPSCNQSFGGTMWISGCLHVYTCKLHVMCFPPIRFYNMKLTPGFGPILNQGCWFIEQTLSWSWCCSGWKTAHDPCHGDAVSGRLEVAQGYWPANVMHMWYNMVKPLILLQKDSSHSWLAEEWFGLAAWWRATNLCHACFMTKHDFLRVPNPLPQLPRRDLQNFLEEALRQDEDSPLSSNSICEFQRLGDLVA